MSFYSRIELSPFRKKNLEPHQIFLLHLMRGFRCCNKNGNSILLEINQAFRRKNAAPGSWSLGTDGHEHGPAFPPRRSATPAPPRDHPTSSTRGRRAPHRVLRHRMPPCSWRTTLHSFDRSTNIYYPPTVCQALFSPLQIYQGSDRQGLCFCVTLSAQDDFRQQ